MTTADLEVLAALTLELTKLRRMEVPHLCIENFAPELLRSLILAAQQEVSNG